MSAPQTAMRLSPLVIGGYYLAVAGGLTAVAPVMLWLSKARAGLLQKLGFLSAEQKARLAAASLSGRPRIWFHSVSVGEFNALYPLLVEFHKEHPEYELFVSTTTRTGQEIAASKAGAFANIFYFPFDLPWITSRFLDLIKPQAVAIVETEIWPGFMDECSKRRLPVVLVNGRFSPRSFEGYKRWRFLFAPVLKQFAARSLQSNAEAERFSAVAGCELPLSVCGNIKFDGATKISTQEADDLRRSLGLSADEQVLVAGSTHDGEETALLEIAQQNNLRLILVPRHPERFDKVASLIQASGRRPRRYTLKEKFESEKDVFLLDTIGQLGRFYSVATLAFVGGTVAPVGGHNLAEPCPYAIPVVCGPHVHKQKELAVSLAKTGALSIAADVSELSSKVKELLGSAELSRKRGLAGKQWLEESQGAVSRTLAVLEKHLPKQELLAQVVGR